MHAFIFLSPASRSWRFTSSGALARADCADTQTEFDDVYCWAKYYIASDDDLNAAYQGADREARCRCESGAEEGPARLDQDPQRANAAATDSEGYSVDLSCAADFTENRTQFLRDREKECEAGHCDLAKLAEVAPSGE